MHLPFCNGVKNVKYLTLSFFFLRYISLYFHDFALIINSLEKDFGHWLRSFRLFTVGFYSLNVLKEKSHFKVSRSHLIRQSFQFKAAESYATFSIKSSQSSLHYIRWKQYKNKLFIIKIKMNQIKEQSLE